MSKRIIWPSVLFLFVSVSLFASDPPVDSKFESSEHVMAGDDVELSFAKNEPGVKGQLLHLPNSLQLTFGDLIAMGDFYGIPEKPIAFGQTDKERQDRFIAAFNTLAVSQTSIKEANQIVGAIHDQRDTVLDGIKRGIRPEETYAHLAEDEAKHFNCLTGGACSGASWWLSPGRFLLLVNQNFDHFGENAILAYTAGHQVALQEAALAGKTRDQRRLEKAYAMDAFASHFLTDRFSSGHMRTPRVELPDNVTPKVIGSLLAGFMHNEECKAGLHVHNARGDRWMAFGDRYYLDERNKTNREMMRDALRISVGDVFAAYTTQSAPASTRLFSLLPKVDENAPNINVDVSPLFYWDETEQKLMRRKNLSDLRDPHWTSHWYGWSTLLELRRIEGLPTDSPGPLLMEGFEREIIGYGL